MTTERLHEFCILAGTLNYSKAAEILYISQSILSRHILELEAELGVQLFLRTTHTVALTDAGFRLLNDSQKLIRTTENLANLLHTSMYASDGMIRIAYSEQTLCTPIVRFLNDFTKKYPNIVLWHEPLCTNIPADYINKYDILISPCEYAQLSGDIKSAFLLSQRALLALPPNHHLNAVQYIALEELRDEALIVPYAEELFGPYARNATLANRLTHGHIHQLSAPSSLSALLMVELGHGICIIPHHLRESVYKHTRVISISTPACRFDIFIYQNAASNNTAANLFFESMVGYFHSLLHIS